MNRITQNACAEGGPKAGGGHKSRPYKRYWGKDIWIFAVCFCSLICFCSGLYLGGLAMRNSIALVEEEISDTKKQLEQSDNSVIVIDRNFAEQIGFSLRMNDMICTGRQ